MPSGILASVSSTWMSVEVGTHAIVCASPSHQFHSAAVLDLLLTRQPRVA